MAVSSAFLREAENAWTGVFANREKQLGTTATLVNFGDSRTAGKLDAATFTGYRFNASGLAPIWTPSVALDTLGDLRVPTNWQGYAPVYTFNGTSHRMTTPDAGGWSRALTVASWGAWVNFTDPASSTILAKFTTAGDLREWRLHTTAASKLQLILSDENDAVTPNATLDTLADTAFVAGQWYFVVATYDGTANASGIDLYVNGVVVASTDTDDANFASMRDTTSIVELGAAENAAFFDGKMLGGYHCPFFVQAGLTAEQIFNLYTA